ncbi:MAG: flavodoxin [Treponemataceae bacterium]
MKKSLAILLVLAGGILLQAQSAQKKVLIAFFSAPEDVALAEVDANSGASALSKKGESLGSTQYMAKTIQQTIGGTLFEITPTTPYPREHKALVDLAKEEQRKKTRPSMSSKLTNVQNYDIIYLGFPVWWYDLPMILYTFLETNNFAGKTIIPFCTHGGSRFSTTIQTITTLQPKATVISDGLAISRNSIAQSENEIKTWAVRSIKEL